MKWCKAFSWCDAPRLESATESWFIANPELSLGDYAQWLRSNLDLWKRKEFSDFKYLGIHLSPARSACLAFITAVLCAAAVVITCAVALSNRDNDRNRFRDYSGLGYELLDKYILKGT